MVVVVVVAGGGGDVSGKGRGEGGREGSGQGGSKDAGRGVLMFANFLISLHFSQTIILTISYS